MRIYKIVFGYNNIISIKPSAGEHHFKGNIYYYLNSFGLLIYAMIKANRESDARIKANRIIKKSSKSELKTFFVF